MILGNFSGNGEGFPKILPFRSLKKIILFFLIKMEMKGNRFSLCRGAWETDSGVRIRFAALIYPVSIVLYIRQLNPASRYRFR